MPLPQVPTERALTFAEAAHCHGRAVSPQTVYSWADAGVKVGEARVKPECARVGGRRVTSVEALDRFLAAMSGEKVELPVPQPAGNKRRDAEDLARLKRELAEI